VNETQSEGEMAKIPDDVLFDSRLIERHIRKNLITRKQADEYLAKTRDASDNAEVLNLDEMVVPHAATSAHDGSVAKGLSWGPRGDTDV